MEYKTEHLSDLNVTARLSEYAPAGGAGEVHIMLNIDRPGETFVRQAEHITAAVRRIAERYAGYRKALMRYFLSDAANQASLLPPMGDGDSVAVSVVEQAPLRGTKIALWVYMVEGIETEKLEGGLVAARHGSYEHIWHAGGGIPDFGSEVATMTLLDDYATRLDRLGIDFAEQCVRTWFFVQNVDVNYAGVVKGRNQVFKAKGLTPATHFIASTGIGGRHADPRVSVQFDAYAVGGLKRGQLGYLYAPTHLNSTYEYGVAFERGATVDYGDRRHLLISGTASIDNKGRVVHPGDIEKQADRMLENIAALLAEGGAGMGDIAQAIIYLRDPADYTVVSRIFEERYPELPRVIVLAPVCRPGWLIEMECMATISRENQEYEPF